MVIYKNGKETYGQKRPVPPDVRVKVADIGEDAAYVITGWDNGCYKGEWFTPQDGDCVQIKGEYGRNYRIFVKN